jgi:hypothetical protein
VLFLKNVKNKSSALCMWQDVYNVKTSGFYSCVDETVLFSFIAEFLIRYSHNEAADLKKLLVR